MALTNEREAQLRGTPLPPDLRDRVRALVEAQGERAAAVTLGIGKHTLMRSLAGAGVRRVTIAAIRYALQAAASKAIP